MTSLTRLAKAIRVYLDTNLLGPNAKDYADEALAVREIEDGRAGGRWSLEWVVSRRTANELEKAPLERREALKAAYDAAIKLEDDHRVKGFSNQDLGAMGYSSNPLVTDVPDEQIFADLCAMGFKAMDARHLTVAIHNKCDVFLTCDKRIVKRREEFQRRYATIRILKPSELLDLLTASAEQGWSAIPGGKNSERRD
jgi:hypothetical protein